MSKTLSAAAFYDEYRAAVSAAMASVDLTKVQATAQLCCAALERDAAIFICGNGGSAAISNHFLCDCGKGVLTDTTLRPRVHSLSTSVELITATANDISYDSVFSLQLSMLARKGDLLISISSSGNSDNVVRALDTAREIGCATVAMTGFSGGRSAALADVNIHVDSYNYGVVEDTHQSLMHGLTQYIRAQYAKS